MKIGPVDHLSDDIVELWKHAIKDVTAKRGGAALLVTMFDRVEESEMLKQLIATSSLWVARERESLRALCVCRNGVVEGIYVVHDHRRQKIASKMIAALLKSDAPPIDGYALPGDRATKSLYESIGWKARLLTMRGAS
jgi:GNAT superfamily N-acetyltransferase